MANYLAQFQSIKNTSDHLVIAIEDVSDLWPVVKNAFHERLPFKKASLNNKTRNPVTVENLSAEFIQTTDARLRARFPQEQALFSFREPYATVILVTCADLDEFKTILKPRLKLIVQNDEKEWFILFVNKTHPSNDSATKMSKRVYSKVEVEFSSKKRERCCKFDLHAPEPHFWEDFESKIMECVRNTLDRRVQFYEDEIRKLSEQRFLPIWNFCNFFILKESLAFMFELAYLHEDSLREFDELELCYLETVNMNGKQRDFGGMEKGDDQAALLNPGNKPLTHIVQDDTFREFEFRQYLFACQAKLLFKLNRPYEVASRGYSFIISFSKSLALFESILPFCMREVWVITACLVLVDATSSKDNDGPVAADVEKEFFRLQGDLYSLSRVKFMRLAYLLGYGPDIERTPANSAALSMLPWPKPAVWPLVPPDASSEVLLKEKMILQTTSRTKHFGIQRKPLPLEPSVLLREANRRRASLSAGNLFEMLDGGTTFGESLGSDVSVNTSPPRKAVVGSMTRTNSTPGNFEACIDRPMRLAEIHVAADNALKQTISSPELWKSLSSVEDFEQKYLELTKGAAENYRRSWWNRHGVALDGEIAAVCHKHGNFDLAARSYEKVCALYAGEGWQDLLAEVLPSLAECQKILNDKAGYLQSCVRLLSLDKGLFLTKERQAFQSEVVNLAHSEMKNPVPLDVSSLITFSGNPGPPLELCDGDPGTISVIVWSGFPDDITLESLSLTLIDTHNADEGAKATSSCSATMLKPGWNAITLSLPPQKPGSYVLGVLTGQIGHLRFRSHSFSKGAPADSDDFMSYEKPTRPILKVFRPRALVDLAPAVSSALLINEPQWIGIIVKPLNYSLKGGVLSIDTGPGLKIEDSHVIEMEEYTNSSHCSVATEENNSTKKDRIAVGSEELKKLTLKDGKIYLPDWASDLTSVLWIPVRAESDEISRAAFRQLSVVDGMRTIALNLEFGVSYNQSFDRTLAVHFTDPFYVNTRVIDKCNGTMLLQVTLHSQVKAMLSIQDAWLNLQDGFLHPCENGGRPTCAFFPLVISPSSKAGMLFSICLGVPSYDEVSQNPESVLNISYRISGDRNRGAHTPTTGSTKQDFIFKSAFVLQRPILDPCLAVGFLPLPSDGLRVGQLVAVNWRIERLKDFEENATSNSHEVLYEINANSENWMIAGRKRGHISLSTKPGSRVVVSILCVPLMAGYVRPPHLGLPNVDEVNISCNPPAPHLVCVLPPVLSSSYCVPA